MCNILKSDKHALKEIVKENKVYEAIKNSQGRTILGEIVVGQQNKYDNISNAELLNNFGCDLITLKKYDYQNYKLDKYNEFENLSSLIGLNFEIKNDSNFEKDTLTEQNIEVLVNEEIDYVVLTIYPTTAVNIEFLETKLMLVRKYYNGFVILNPYVSNLGINLDNMLSYIEMFKQYNIQMVTLPIPGTMPFITEQKLAPIISELNNNNILCGGCICTSQEGSTLDVITNLALDAKKCGFDLHMFGDAAACSMPEEENVFNYSLSIRGRRHTYFRMVK